MDERRVHRKGQKMSRNRDVATESVFGLLKQNDGMRRLLIRGTKMVQVEVGSKSLAHNLRKMRTDILDGLAQHLMRAMILYLANQAR